MFSDNHGALFLKETPEDIVFIENVQSNLSVDFTFFKALCNAFNGI